MAIMREEKQLVRKARKQDERGLHVDLAMGRPDNKSRKLRLETIPAWRFLLQNLVRLLTLTFRIVSSGREFWGLVFKCESNTWSNGSGFTCRSQKV